MPDKPATPDKPEKPNKRPIEFDPKKMQDALQRSVLKARELGWDPNAPREEVDAAIKKPNFVSVKIGNIWGPWKTPEGGNDGGFTIHWGAEKIGFGEITFAIKDGRLVCDTEAMSPEFVRAAVQKLLETGVVYDPK